MLVLGEIDGESMEVHVEVCVRVSPYMSNHHAFLMSRRTLTHKSQQHFSPVPPPEVTLSY